MPKVADLREGLANYLEVPPHQLDAMIGNMRLVISAGELLGAGAQVKPQDPWCITTNTMAGPADRAHIGVHNPTGSGVDAYIHSVGVTSQGATQALQIRKGSTPPAGAGDEYYLDERLYPGGPACLGVFEDHAGIGGQVIIAGRVSTTYDWIHTFERPLVLIPGRCLFAMGDATKSFGAWFTWEEKTHGP